MALEPNLTEQDYELLSAYIDGMLDEPDRTALEARLTDEPVLRRELNALRQTVALVKNLPPMQAPRDFTLSGDMLIAAGISPQPVARRPLPRSRRMLDFPVMTALSAAAAFVLIAFGLLIISVGGADDARDELTAAEVAFGPTLDANETLSARNAMEPEVAITASALAEMAADSTQEAVMPFGQPAGTMTQSSNFATGGAGFAATELMLTEQAEARTLDMAEMADDAEVEEEAAPADTQSDAAGEALSIVAPTLTPQPSASPSRTVTAPRTATPPPASTVQPEVPLASPAAQGIDETNDTADSDTAAGAPPAPAMGGALPSPTLPGTQPFAQTAIAMRTTTATMDAAATGAIAAQMQATEAGESDGAAANLYATETAAADDVTLAAGEADVEDETGFSALDLLGAALVALGFLAVIAVFGTWAAGGDRNMSETDRLAP